MKTITRITVTSETKGKFQTLKDRLTPTEKRF